MSTFSYRFPCIKCKNAYDTNDVEPDYCDACKVEKTSIAAKIDKQFSTVKSKPMSDLEAFDAEAKVFKSPTGRTISFGRG